MGEMGFGEVLYVLGILAIFAPAIGLAANNARLIEQREIQVQNADVLLAVLSLTIPSLAVFLFASGMHLSSIKEQLVAGVLLLLTTLRYYGDVEYRMTLYYKGYFEYYAIISCGYLLGLLIYPLTRSWMLVFLIGELACNLWLLRKGHIYRPLVLSADRKHINRKIRVLTYSYLLYNAVLNLDRIMLQNLMGSKIVTVYYVASLLGKTAALLVGPLNGVIIGYLSKSKVRLTTSQYVKVAGIVLGMGSVLFLGIVIVTPAFVRLFYGNIAAQVQEIYVWASLSQVICFASSLILTIMLTFCTEIWQFVIQGIYAVGFVVFCMLGTTVAGIQGFVIGCLLANILRFILSVVAGVFLLYKQRSTDTL